MGSLKISNITPLLGNIKVGSINVSEIYCGTTLVWPIDVPPPESCLFTVDAGQVIPSCLFNVKAYLGTCIFHVETSVPDCRFNITADISNCIFTVTASEYQNCRFNITTTIPSCDFNVKSSIPDCRFYATADIPNCAIYVAAAEVNCLFDIVAYKQNIV